MFSLDIKAYFMVPHKMLHIRNLENNEGRKEGEREEKRRQRKGKEERKSMKEVN